MNLIEKFGNSKILVIGDVMLDRYWWGDVTRISPEAPVPVVRLRKDSVDPGGAANVAVNVAGLSATAYLVGVVGHDAEGKSLANSLEAHNVSPDHLVRSSSRTTNVKTRVIAHSQQVVRIDQEITLALSPEDEAKICDTISETAKEADLILVSDYAKGVLTAKVLSTLFKLAREYEKPILVDPKGKDYSKYLGASVLTPNRREAAEACNFDEDGEDLVDRAGRKLIEDLDLSAVLVTQSEDGMTLFERNKAGVRLGSLAKAVYDVTGAGDTVIATMAVALASGSTYLEAARIANIAAGIVVEQIGTTAISRQLLETRLD